MNSRRREGSFLFVSWLVAWAALIFFSSCASVPKLETPPPQVSLSATDGGYDAELRNFPYPREVRFFPLRSQRQDLSMAYVLAEPAAGNGRTVLLLHGKNFSAAYWEPTIKALVDSGFRVIAPDQIGFGKSSKPDRYQFSFQALARNTFDLLDDLKIDQVEVVGHSMGGMLAVRMALLEPKRVTKLALVNPIGLEDYRIRVPYRTVEELYRQELKATPDSIREYQREAYFDGNWQPEYEDLVQIPLGWLRHPQFPAVAWNNALTTDMILTQPVVYELPLLRVPTLLIIGLRDTTAVGKAWASPENKKLLGNYPALAKATAKAIPGVKLVAIPGVGHLPQVEAWEKYIETLRGFL